MSYEAEDVFVEFLRGNPSTADIGRKFGISNPTAWRIISSYLPQNISLMEARKIIRQGQNLVLYQVFQILRDEETVSELFGIPKDKVHQSLQATHEMLKSEHQGKLTELKNCQRCGAAVESAVENVKKYCDTCRLIVSRENTQKRVKKWLAKPGNKERSRAIARKYNKKRWASDPQFRNRMKDQTKRWRADHLEVAKLRDRINYYRARLQKLTEAKDCDSDTITKVALRLQELQAELETAKKEKTGRREERKQK